MKKLSIIILVFSLAFLIFFIGPAFLGAQFPLYPLMKVSDVFDLFTPIILIPLYWYLYQLDGNRPTGIKGSLIFMVLAAFWVMGQGMESSRL